MQRHERYGCAGGGPRTDEYSSPGVPASFRHVPERRHGFLTAFTTMRISAARGPLSADAPYLTRTLSY
jgi:hypothetical protein